ncbi:hypothetical protein BCV70DRAFT_100810 [Testicularia cyperi]|uniref:Uncharacterized protein n=1 Tax=Testicularia cyperi TaxID=1882483 RepID=A0A317XQZ4_9BASI|nr:hypothetical protein BCV70DRAFT_100810 [Testicularia cyperi]
MTVSEILSPHTPSTATTDWFELAVLGRSMALREAKRAMASPAGLGSGEEASSSASKCEAGPASASSSARPAASHAFTNDSTMPSHALANGDTLAPPHVSSQAAQQTSLPAALRTAMQKPAISNGDADILRTEVMGPPPRLPNDPAYPPLNPRLEDVTQQPPAPKRRAPTSQANRRASPLHAPADFQAPTNINGKMPYALFHKLQQAQQSQTPTQPVAQVKTEPNDALELATFSTPPLPTNLD